MSRLGRRSLLSGGGALLAGGCAGGPPRQAARAARGRARQGPGAPLAIQSGDASASSVVLWAKGSGPGRLVVEWTARADRDFRGAVRRVGPLATAATDHTARLVAADLPSGARLAYRVAFLDEASGTLSPFVEGTTRTAPGGDGDLLFAWSGDTAGQGWGIDPSRGGMRSYRAMQDVRPDFFVHLGDMIYADGVLLPEVRLEDGTLWRNLVTEAKSRVAETLDDFRGNYTYNFLCEHLRRFAAEVPLYAIWDDHEVRNDWWPGQVLDDDRYREKRVDVLAQRARRARVEHLPLREEGSFTRSVLWGPGLELFLVDGRSHRGPDTVNLEAGGAPLLGEEQLAWLVRGVTSSRATWKIVGLPVPIGLVLPHGEGAQDGFGNGDGPPLGRELEIASLLSACRAAGVKNLLFLAADVHYAALHAFHPDRAVYKDFFPFHECVAGPLHASSYPPKRLDPTFGPEVSFQLIEPSAGGSGPWAGRQSFGTVEIAEGSHRLTVRFFSGEGRLLHAQILAPESR